MVRGQRLSVRGTSVYVSREKGTRTSYDVVQKGWRPLFSETVSEELGDPGDDMQSDGISHVLLVVRQGRRGQQG